MASTLRIAVEKSVSSQRYRTEDVVAVEEPLEIQVGQSQWGQPEYESISITMRTPGQDEELALGFLYTEGVIKSFEDVASVHLGGPLFQKTHSKNIVRVELKDHIEWDSKRLERHFYTSSSCGVCGKTSIEAVQRQKECLKQRLRPGLQRSPGLTEELLAQLPQKLYSSQGLFQETGGLHAAALFDAHGSLVRLREDVGRHNAMDKLVGSSLEKSELPLHTSLLLLSGRASFELIQKAAMAQIPVVASIGAPSSLAVELAVELDITLLGFLRKERFNLYHGKIEGARETTSSN